jgi:hypothetical protein
MSFTFRISKSRLIALNVPPFTSTPYQQTDNPLKQKARLPASFFLNTKFIPAGDTYFILCALCSMLSSILSYLYSRATQVILSNSPS